MELSGDLLQRLPDTAGRRLPDAVLRKMETAFGASFSDVRTFVGPEAARIGALAFTIGSRIHFAPGQYHPETPHGQRLLGHELTHVLQQRAGRVRNPFGTGLAVVQDPALETEADRFAARVVGQPAPPPSPFQPHRAQRGAADEYASSGSMQAKSRVGGTLPPNRFRIAPPRGVSGGRKVVAIAGGAEVGSVEVRPRRGGAEVVNLVVNPAYRHRGAGVALLKEAATVAARMGLNTMTLEAQDTRTGRLVNWYKRFGFVLTGKSQRGHTTMAAPTSAIQRFSLHRDSRELHRMPRVAQPMLERTPRASATSGLVIQRMLLPGEEGGGGGDDQPWLKFEQEKKQKSYKKNEPKYAASVYAAQQASMALQSKLATLGVRPKVKTIKVPISSFTDEPGVTALINACATVKQLKLKINTLQDLFSLPEIENLVTKGTLTEQNVITVFDAIRDMCNALALLLSSEGGLKLLNALGIWETLNSWTRTKACITSLAESIN